jgi:hypothetical protein
LCCFTFVTGVVLDFYVVETSLIRTSIGVKLNNSAKQMNKAKEGAKEGGRTDLDGGAGGVIAKVSSTAGLLAGNPDQPVID